MLTQAMTPLSSHLSPLSSHLNIYIQAASQISIQQPLSEQWITQPIRYAGQPFVKAINPTFRDYIPANEARRMGPVVKRALVTALKVLQDTAVSQPDAIITGTSLGALDATEQFLAAMVENGEETMSPTHFMQSTHNTIGSALAIFTRNHGYNTTYSHGSLSFELALQDAAMQMQLGNISNALVGAHDEMVDSYYQLLQKTGNVPPEGTVPYSETAVSMLLNTAANDDTLCRLAGLRCFYASSAESLKHHIQALLDHAGITIDDISVVFTGANGNADNDRYYQTLVDTFSVPVPLFHYKQLFGENYSVSALAVYAAAHLLKHADHKVILILNQMEGRQYALTLLSRL